MTIISRFLDTNGDGTGTKSAVGNYASTSDIFYIQPPAGTKYLISRMIVSVQDTGIMAAEDYGATAAALTNGITIREQDDSGTNVDFCDGEPVTSNAGWGAFCYDVAVKTWGTGDELLLVRWTFAQSGSPVSLNGDLNERLEVFLNDDFTGLVDHKFMVQGTTSEIL